MKKILLLIIGLFLFSCGKIEKYPLKTKISSQLSTCLRRDLDANYLVTINEGINIVVNIKDGKGLSDKKIDVICNKIFALLKKDNPNMDISIAFKKKDKIVNNEVFYFI